MEIDFAIKDNHYEPVVDFDYGAVDRGNPLTAEIEGGHSADQIKDLASAMSRILQWCWVNGYNNNRPNKSSYIHFVAMTAALRPDLVGDSSYQKLGKDLGVTRAWMSRLALQFQDEFGCHFRRSRRQGSRANMSNGQKHKHHVKAI
jgi:hypothetical protein